MEAADGAKRLVQAAAIHTPVQSHNSAVFSRRSCNGGGDVEGRWKPEINVSNHLELEGAPSHWKEARFQIPEFFKRPMPI